MLPRAVLRRLVPLVAAGAALACAVVPAGAHEGQDDRPGAAQMDLEVLITPPINGETSPGGHAPSVAVDSRGNVLATALKEDLQPATVDGRAPTHVRAGSWRWSSGDDGLTFVNVAGQPFQADALAPGGRSVAAAADDRGRGFLLEAYDGIGVLTVTRSNEKDDIAVDAVRALPAGSVVGRTRLAAHGDGRLFVLAAPRTGPTSASTGPPQTGGYALYRSDDAGASFSDLVGVNLDQSDQCDVAAGHAPGSKQVVVACAMGDRSVATFSSYDDGRSFSKALLIPEDGTLLPERPSVAVGPDGSTSVVVATLTPHRERRTLLLLRSTDRGRTWRKQDVAIERGDWSGASLAVNKRGRLAIAAYHRTSREAGWHVRLATFTAGRRPVYVDFASHDPVTPKGWFDPPADATAVSPGPDSRFHLLWTSIKVVVPSDVVANDTSLIRNVWSVRTLST